MVTLPASAKGSEKEERKIFFLFFFLGDVYNEVRLEPTEG